MLVTKGNISVEIYYVYPKKFMFQGFEENTHFVKYYKFRLFKQLLDKERFQQSCFVKPRLANGIH